LGESSFFSLGDVFFASVEKVGKKEGEKKERSTLGYLLGPSSPFYLVVEASSPSFFVE